MNFFIQTTCLAPFVEGIEKTEYDERKVKMLTADYKKNGFPKSDKIRLFYKIGPIEQPDQRIYVEGFNLFHDDNNKVLAALVAKIAVVPVRIIITQDQICL